MISWFRVFGFLAVLLGALVFVQIAENAPARAAGLRDISSLWIVGAGLLVVGTGLLGHRKWAAGLFAAATGVCGVWLMSSLFLLPLQFALINTLFGLLLLLPLWATVRYWRLLVWRGRWCF